MSASSTHGFTLIEMVITLALVGMLTAIAVPTAELVVQRSKEQDLRLALREMRRAIDAYKQAYDDGRMLKKVDESGYPPSLKVLVDGVEDAKSPTKRKMFFLRRIPRDPMAVDAQSAPEETWGLRSYESDADDPHDGREVFDVYSKSPSMGINGVPYRKW